MPCTVAVEAALAIDSTHLAHLTQVSDWLETGTGGDSDDEGSSWQQGSTGGDVTTKPSSYALLAQWAPKSYRVTNVSLFNLTLWRPLLSYGTAAIKYPVPDRVKPWASECPDVKNYKWRFNPVWHRMLYSCTHMATVSVKGLINSATSQRICLLFLVSSRERGTMSSVRS